MSQQEHILSVYIHHSANASAQQRMWQSQPASQKNLLSIGFSLSSKVFLGLKKIRLKRIIEIEEGMATLVCSGTGKNVEIITVP